MSVLPANLATFPASQVSQTDMYFLAARARSKLTKEASRHDHDLRVLVTHANLLDNVMDSLADARRKARKEQLEKLKQMQAPQTTTVQFELPVVSEKTNNTIQIIEEENEEEDDKEIIVVSSLHSNATPSIVSREVEEDEDEDEYYTSSDSDSDSDSEEEYESDSDEDEYYYNNQIDIVDSLHSSKASSYKVMPTIEEENEPTLSYSSSSEDEEEEEEEQYISSYTHHSHPVYKNHKMNNSQTQLVVGEVY